MAVSVHKQFVTQHSRPISRKEAGLRGLLPVRRRGAAFQHPSTGRNGRYVCASSSSGSAEEPASSGAPSAPGAIGQAEEEEGFGPAHKLMTLGTAATVEFALTGMMRCWGA